MNPYAPTSMMFDPYQGMIQPSGYDWQSEQQRIEAEMEAIRRQQEAEEQQRNQQYNQFGNNIGEYLAGQPAGAAPTVMPAGMTGSAGINAAGGTLQASTAAPLAQAAPLATGSPLAGGSVVGPMSTTAAGMSTPVAGSAAAGTVPAAAMPAAAGAGAGAGAGSGAGTAAAGAGAGALGTAGMIAAPVAAALGTMQWTNNVEDDVNWGTWFTDPGKGWQAAAENVSEKLGIEDTAVGNWLEAPMGIIAPRSFDQWTESMNDAFFIDEGIRLGKNLWEPIGDAFGSIGDLFSGIF